MRPRLCKLVQAAPARGPDWPDRAAQLAEGHGLSEFRFVADGWEVDGKLRFRACHLETACLYPGCGKVRWACGWVVGGLAAAERPAAGAPAPRRPTTTLTHRVRADHARADR